MRIILVFIFLVLFGVQNIHAIEKAQKDFPQRIISLAPSLTKNLYLLGADDLLVGCTNYCVLQSDTDVEVVANAIKVNYEKVILLKTDLIITTDLTPLRSIETFKKYGIEVLVFPNPKSFEEICKQFEELGEIVGKREIANKILLKAKEKLESLTANICKKTSSSMFMQLGANPLFSVLPGTFMNDLISFSGHTNVADELKSGAINKEFVLLKNPEVIIIVLMGSLGEEEKENWARFNNLRAVKNKQVYLLNADNACSPTPVSFLNALEELIDLFDEKEEK